MVVHSATLLLFRSQASYPRTTDDVWAHRIWPPMGVDGLEVINVFAQEPVHNRPYPSGSPSTDICVAIAQWWRAWLILLELVSIEPLLCCLVGRSLLESCHRLAETPPVVRQLLPELRLRTLRHPLGRSATPSRILPGARRRSATDPWQDWKLGSLPTLGELQ